MHTTGRSALAPGRATPALAELATSARAQCRQWMPGGAAWKGTEAACFSICRCTGVEEKVLECNDLLWRNRRPEDQFHQETYRTAPDIGGTRPHPSRSARIESCHRYPRSRETQLSSSLIRTHLSIKDSESRKTNHSMQRRCGIRRISIYSNEYPSIGWPGARTICRCSGGMGPS